MNDTECKVDMLTLYAAGVELSDRELSERWDCHRRKVRRIRRWFSGVSLDRWQVGAILRKTRLAPPVAPVVAPPEPGDDAVIAGVAAPRVAPRVAPAKGDCLVSESGMNGPGGPTGGPGSGPTSGPTSGVDTSGSTSTPGPTGGPSSGPTSGPTPPAGGPIYIEGPRRARRERWEQIKDADILDMENEEYLEWKALQVEFDGE